MMKMVNKMRGNVYVEVKGVFPERFLNLSAQNGILFWGVEKIDDICIRARMYEDGYKKLLELARTAGFDVKILKKDGAPFFLRGLRKRYALLAGLIIFIIVTAGVNQFIFEFEVQGNHLISDEIILKNLADIGVKIGTHTASINIPEIRNEMISRIDSLLWISVNVSGSRAVVVVRERVPKPYMVSLKQPCNIVSQGTGVIVEMDVYAGAPQVQVGQTVEKGDLLVSGIVNSNVVGARFVHSMAYVKARTWRDMTASTPLKVFGKNYTGRVHRRNAIIIADKRINLYKEGSAPYENYDKIVKTAVLRVPPGVTFPLQMVTEEYIEYTIGDYSVDEKDAEELLRESLDKRLYRSLGRGEVSSLNITVEKKGDMLEARLNAECLEEIDTVVEMP